MLTVDIPLTTLDENQKDEILKPVNSFFELFT